MSPRVCRTDGIGLLTRDSPQTAPEKDDFRLRCQSSTDLSDLQRPTQARRTPCSGCHGGGKRAFENTILGADAEHSLAGAGERHHAHVEARFEIAPDPLQLSLGVEVDGVQHLKSDAKRKKMVDREAKFAPQREEKET